MYIAYTSAHVVPSLSCSFWFCKSSLYQIRSSWPDVSSRGFFKPLKTISLEFALYPGRLYHVCSSGKSGSRMTSFDVVIIVPSALYQQPQLDEGGDNIPQLTQPLTWISLTASTNPPTSTLNLPNWSSFAPKHTGAVFSLRHGASIFENKSKYENATYHCKKTSKEEHNMIWNRFVEQN